MVVVTELWLVARALEGGLCPVPSQTEHPGADLECRARGESTAAVCPDPRAPGGLQHRADPSNPWHCPGAPRSCWNAANPTPRSCSCSGLC